MNWLARRLSALVVVLGFLGALPWAGAGLCEVRVVDLAAETEATPSDDEEETSKFKAKQLAARMSQQSRARRRRQLRKNRPVVLPGRTALKVRRKFLTQRAPPVQHYDPVLRRNLPPRLPLSDDDECHIGRAGLLAA